MQKKLLVKRSCLASRVLDVTDWFWIFSSREWFDVLRPIDIENRKLR